MQFCCVLQPSTIAVIAQLQICSRSRNYSSMAIVFKINRRKKCWCGVIIKDIADGAVVLGSISTPVKSDTATNGHRHCCDNSGELWCPGAKPRRWVRPLATRFGVIPRVRYIEDLNDGVRFVTNQRCPVVHWHCLRI